MALRNTRATVPQAVDIQEHTVKLIWTCVSARRVKTVEIALATPTVTRVRVQSVILELTVNKNAMSACRILADTKAFVTTRCVDTRVNVAVLTRAIGVSIP